MFGVYVHACGASGVWFLATCCWTTPPIFFAPTSRDATVEINGVSGPEIVFYFCLCMGIGGENGFPRVFPSSSISRLGLDCARSMDGRMDCA